MNCLNENLVIVIPARKNSKRLKNKNFKDFHGFPLFEWSIAAGLFLKHQLGGSKKISVICSSDDHQILGLIKKKYISNVYAIQRSAKLSDDKATLSDVIIDCIHRLADEGMICVDDYLGGSFILLQPTSPIRLKNDLVNFCSQIRDLGDYHSVVSVNRRYKLIKDVYEIIGGGPVPKHIKPIWPFISFTAFNTLPIEFKNIYGIKDTKIKRAIVNFNLFFLKATRPFLPPFFRLIAPARWAKQRITRRPDLKFKDKSNI